MNPTGVPVRLGAVGPVLLRVGSGVAALILVAGLAGGALVDPLVPVWRAVFEALAGEFRVLDLAIDGDGAHRMLRVRVTLREIVLLGQRVLYPDPRGVASAATAVGHALHIPAAAVLVGLAWPGRGRATLALRTTVALLLAAPLVLLDLPLVLAGHLWQILVDHLAPGTPSPLIAGQAFLTHGGRWLAGTLAGIAAVRLIPGSR
ncbi:MAG: hypothetical protein WCJ69_14940 [Betaproteobacteria bacterium]